MKGRDKVLYENFKPTSKLNLIISDKYERINSSTFDFNITIIASDYKKNNRTSFVVLPNLIDAQKYYDSLYNILEEDVLFYPVDETTKNALLISSRDFERERVSTIIALLSGKPKIVVTNINGILKCNINKERWINSFIELELTYNKMYVFKLYY